MSILTQTNLIPQAIISNGLVTGNPVQNPDNLLNTTDQTAIFGATSDVIVGNFPFNIPLDAIIVGISGIIKARIDNISIPAGSLTPAMYDGTTFFPGIPVTGLSNVLQEYAIGGAYDVWGNVSWTPTKINNLKFQMTANSSLEVAWVSLTVHYYIPQITPVPPPFSLPGCADCDSEIQALPFELIQPWLPGQTTLRVKNFWTPDGTFIDLAMIGACGGTINLTVDPDLRKEDGGNFIENFNIDASLATITQFPGYTEIDIGNINQRGLGFSTPYGHDVANISAHAVGAVVIITNNGPYSSKLLKRCHIGTLVSAPITVEDEGSTVTVATDIFNFRGDPVQASQDPSDQFKVNVDVIANPTNVDPTIEDENDGTNDPTPSLTLTVPLTIVSANYLRVAVITEDEVISGVTYNGIAMTQIGEQSNPGVNLKVALYGLINPTVGAHNAVVTMPTPRIITAIVTSWLDVDTTSPVDGVSTGAIGSDNAPTDSVTTTTENTVVQDVVGTTNNPTTFSQFGLWAIDGDVNTGIRPGASSSRRVLAPQLVTDTYSISVATGWAILLAGIRGITNPTGGVQSVTGNYIDNTDPVNPVSVVPLNNTAGLNPTVTDDNTLGYFIDSKWFNSVTGVLWTCEDATTGAAVWTAITGGSVQNNPTAVVAPTVNDDSVLGYSVGSYWFDTITGTLYIAQDVTVGAAVWEAVAGGGGSGSALSFNVNQTGHGLSVGDPIKSNGVDNQFALSSADSAANAETVGIVTVVTDANNFTYVSSATQLSGGFVPVGTPGEAVWLDPAGGLTITRPSVIGQIARGLGTIIASGATMYFDIAALGEEITSSSGGSFNVLDVTVFEDFLSGTDFDSNDVNRMFPYGFVSATSSDSGTWLSELDHPGIVGVDTPNNSLLIRMFGDTSGGLPGGIPLDNDFELEILTRCTYNVSASAHTANYALNNSGPNQPTVIVDAETGVTNIQYVLFATSGTTTIPASATWFKIKWSYASGTLSLYIDYGAGYVLINSEIGNFGSNDGGFVDMDVTLAGGGVMNLQTDYVLLNYQVTR